MAIRIRRRELIVTLGGAAAWPLATRAQQPAMPVIGFLSGASPDSYAPMVVAFRQGLREAGYVEGYNVAIEYRWAQDHYDRLSALAADLVRRPVTVITANTPAAPVAKTATTTLPIVFVTASDPVLTSLVVSLNRPGGNLTGVAILAVELGPKRLELLHELIPTATVMALLINPTNPNAQTQSTNVEAAARGLGLKLHLLHASTELEIDTAFATLAQLRAGALVIGTDGFLVGRSKQIAALAIRHAVPAIYQFHEFAAAGGLMSYGSSITDAYRQVGAYTARVLKGEKPADLPVQQSTKVELIINLRTAKTLGLTVPLTLLGRADEVIE